MSEVLCEIESRSDFLTGMYLIARIPDSDLDENALLTIQDDCPGFILPFNYKSVNGYTEFTYKVGSLSRLQYFYGDMSRAEYAALWQGLLSPLLECRDWFMRPDSFVLSTQHLYYDKGKNSVAYVYIPSVNGCSGAGAFNEMVSEVSKSLKVSDPVLENKVLRSIINDFQPKEFLRMLLEYAHEPEQPCAGQAEKQNEENVPGEEGMPADEQMPEEQEALPAHQVNGIKLFSRKGRKATKTKRNGFKNTVQGALPGPAMNRGQDASGTTQETKAVTSGAGLRCIGRVQLPQVIEVEISDGGVFTIGRFDANIGKKRSSFEFETKTKAVSRRHAAIERTGTAYRIVDLASSAGTFLNDRKLPPNTPAGLEPGFRVSFGNMGADYVWEVS